MPIFLIILGIENRYQLTQNGRADEPIGSLHTFLVCSLVPLFTEKQGSFKLVLYLHITHTQFGQTLRPSFGEGSFLSNAVVRICIVLNCYSLSSTIDQLDVHNLHL